MALEWATHAQARHGGCGQVHYLLKIYESLVNIRGMLSARMLSLTVQLLLT